jgi:hypothetical protein
LSGNGLKGIVIDTSRSKQASNRMRIETLAVLLAALSGSACAQMAPLRINTAKTAVPVVAVLEEKPAGAAELGPLTTTTCLNRFWDSRPGWDVALDATKQQASAMGANALTDVRYEEGNVLLCSTSLKITAVALRVP